MFVVKHKKIFLILSIVFIAVAIFFIFYDGLNLSIDFTGGSVLEVSYPFENSPSLSETEQIVSQVLNTSVSVRQTEKGFSIRTPFLEGDERTAILEALSLGGEAEVEEERFSSVGPIVGKELRKKALIAISLVILAIIIFVAFVFRKISKPVSSWTYGLVAVIALFHDIIIPTGFFAFLGVAIGAQIDILFITALLAILGYSVNDTIVVFDRIRENLEKNKEENRREEFSETVGRSLNQTYIRSINTSLTTLIVLIVLFILGGEVTRNFTLVLITGVIAGTYSSIFFASPLLVWIEEKRSKKRK